MGIAASSVSVPGYFFPGTDHRAIKSLLVLTPPHHFSQTIVDHDSSSVSSEPTRFMFPNRRRPRASSSSQTALTILFAKLRWTRRRISAMTIPTRTSSTPSRPSSTKLAFRPFNYLLPGRLVDKRYRARASIYSAANISASAVSFPLSNGGLCPPCNHAAHG